MRLTLTLILLALLSASILLIAYSLSNMQILHVIAESNTNATNNTTAINITQKVIDNEKKIEDLSKRVSQLESTMNGVNEKLDTIESRLTLIYHVSVAALVVSTISLIAVIAVALTYRQRKEKKKIAGKIRK